jgi:serine protease Do
MAHRDFRIPVWLVVPALFAIFIVGSRAGSSVQPDVRPAIRIVTPEVSDVITQDLNPEIARNLHITQQHGVLVNDVVGSPLYPGDVILSVNGVVVNCQSELDAQLSQVIPGQTFIMDVYRDGRIQTVTAQRAMETPPLTVLPDTQEIRGISIASLSTQNGVIVANVRIGTPASDMGLKTGDIILDVNGHRVRSAAEFTQFIRLLNGRPATVNVRHRNGQIDVFEIAS